MAKAPRWVGLLALAAGFAYGMHESAKEVKVPPKFEFISPDEELLKSVPSKDEVLSYLVEELRAKGVEVRPEALVDAAERIVKRLRLIARREFYTSMIIRLTEAYSEGRINSAVYVARVKRYVEKLKAVERELSLLASEGLLAVARRDVG